MQTNWCGHRCSTQLVFVLLVWKTAAHSCLSLQGQCIQNTNPHPETDVPIKVREGGGHKPNIGTSYIDISTPIGEGLPVWESATGISPDHRVVKRRMSKGDSCNYSWLNFGCHTGTHVDATSHFIQEEFEAGQDILDIPLSTLIGPVLVLDIPPGQNVSREALEATGIPLKGVERIIFRTANTQEGLMFSTPFATHAVGVTSDGADWLMENAPDLLLVGIDYLSIACYEVVAEVHQTLFRKGIVVVEGLDLRRVEPGVFKLTCLPVAIRGAEGSPARCMLEGWQDS